MMNYIIIIINILIFLPSQFFGMYTTFNKPTYWTEKPRFDRFNMSTYELNYSHGWASKSFNLDGKKVPLLNYSNPEPLLPSFVDCNVSCKNNKPIAYALFDANYSVDTIHNEIKQNIYKHFFLMVNIPMAHAHLKNISITPTNKNGCLIDPTKEINDYIEKLYPKLFDDCAIGQVQEKYYIGPSFFLFGYMKSFNHFTRIDMLDVSVKTGLVIPVTTLTNSRFNLFPRTDQLNFGIPLDVQMMIGIYDWLNIGASATVINFIQSNRMADINTNPYPNKIIFPKKELTNIWHHPQILCTAYIEGEYLLPHWTWYAGITYAKQYETEFSFCQNQKYLNDIAKDNPPLLSWEQLNIMLSSEIDFSSEPKKCMPRCKIVYCKRIFGKGCFDSSLFTGQLGFEFLYDF